MRKTNPCGGTKIEYLQAATLHRLDRPKQGLPQGPVPSAAHRPDHGFHGRLRVTVLPGCLLRVSPDHDGGRGPGEDGLHHLQGLLLLHSEAECYLPARDAGVPRASAGPQC